jgi:AmmeMemoRadiSam system protein B
VKTKTRPSFCAGSFYPADPQALKTNLASYLQGKKNFSRRPFAFIVPHAGYIYSGPVAGKAYAPLKAYADSFDRVVLFGPAHRVFVEGLALSSADVFETPLGDIPVDQSINQFLFHEWHLPFFDEAHREEHSLEVQLPFLQEVLGDFSIVPLLVGEVSPEQVAELIEKLASFEKTLLVFSSDLSHFLSYEVAVLQDRRTAEKIENFDGVFLKGEEACGARALNALLLFSKRRSLTIEAVALNNSGDTAGARDRVVGYGAWVVYDGS